jgi:two-component system phosphate regulon sensor histidine kinase PhoR
MTNEMIRRLVILGAISILGIVSTQAYWIVKAYNLKDSEFHQTVSIALGKVAETIAKVNNSELPKQNIVERRSSNYYAVNINDGINAAVLEDNLLTEFEKNSLDIDFEYAVYDCFSQELVYGNYCQLSDGERQFERSAEMPAVKDLDYYFVVKFPSRESYLLSNIQQNILLSVLSFLALGFFIYSTWVILQQKRLSELQKDFINNMTHEFKTPISSIKVAAEVLKKNDNIQRSERLSNYAQIIIDQNARLNDQVEKFLNLAKMEGSDLKLQKTTFDLEKALQKIVKDETLKHQELKEFEIKTHFTGQEIMINADRLHFSNIITNILDNAVKYSGSNKLIALEVIQGSNNTKVKISDNGNGMDKETSKKIFTKFYRVPSGNIHNVKGFGLGLYYVKNICNAHQWDIVVDSKLGEGSCFTITIPFAN